jgi:hypothetical protein
MHGQVASLIPCLCVYGIFPVSSPFYWNVLHRNGIVGQVQQHIKNAEELNM